MTLTQKQRDIYLFIRRRIQSNNPPSVREIQAAFGIASPNGCMSHLKALQKKGMIDWDRKEHRSLRLLQEPLVFDIEGNVHSFAWVFAPGNSISRDGELLDGENVVIGSIERVGQAKA